MFPREPLDSSTAPADGEGDHDGGGDSLPLRADLMLVSGPSDGEQDRIEADDGE
jgi:hypothetical protein